MGTKNNPGAYDCYANAEPDEPMFILLGRDPFAASLVRLWAAARGVIRTDKKKLDEALACAESMEAWCAKSNWSRSVLEWLPFDVLADEMRRRDIPLPVIKPVVVERDSVGGWIHPDFPWNAVLDDCSFAPVAEGLGLELSSVSFDDDAPQELQDRVMDTGESAMADWEPSKPAGEGWFLLAIFDTEDGQYATWARPKSST